MKPIRFLPVIAVASILGACASPTPYDLNTSQVRALSDSGNDFQKALHVDYVNEAQIAFDETDRGSTTYYNTKARQAAAGYVVLPTAMSERSIPADRVAELTQARANLMRVIDGGGGMKAPYDTSRAQTQFDCWMEVQAENFQPDDILQCKNRFLAALDKASTLTFAAAEPAPARMPAMAAAAPAPKPTVYTVYFDHNQTQLTEAATTMNALIVKHIKDAKSSKVTVNGYADRSGDRDYNDNLARQRATVVANALEATGITPIVGENSFGEDNNAVQTSDGVRESLNRRVTVTVQ